MFDFERLTTVPTIKAHFLSLINYILCYRSKNIVKLGTIVACVNAVGDKMSPLLVVKGKTKIDIWFE